MSIDKVTMKDLLEAGVHFGHQTRRWNPKMARFIYGERNDIYILDLQKTMRQMKRAYKYLRETVRQGGKVLLVSTKKQAQDIIKNEAERCDMFYVNQRWLGGMLTNYQTITRRIKHMKNLEKMEEDGLFEAFSKKEEARNRKQLARLRKYLTGIAEMTNLPDAIFLIDPRRENIALKEAQRLHIPVVAIVDTNCDPEGIDFPIPGNDDAIRAIKIVTNYLVDAMVEGRGKRQAVIDAKKKDDAEAAAKGKEKAAPKKADTKAEAAPKAKAKAEEAPSAEAAKKEAPAEEAKAAVKVVASASPDEDN